MTNTFENWQDLVYRLRWQVALLLVGFILIAGGIFMLRPGSTSSYELVESGEVGTSGQGSLVVEVAGAVNSPGVYELPLGARVEDALILAGGFREDADQKWIAKVLNRASQVSDGQKIYIPSQSEEASASFSGGNQSGSSVLGGSSGTLININTASQSELESLRGIGPVTAQKVIENRPYSTVEELLARKVISQRVYDDNKDKLTVH